MEWWEGGGGDQGVAPEGRGVSEAGVAFHASSTVGVACCSAVDVSLNAAGKPADQEEKFVAVQIPLLHVSGLLLRFILPGSLCVLLFFLFLRVPRFMWPRRLSAHSRTGRLHVLCGFT